MHIHVYRCVYSSTKDLDQVGYVTVIAQVARNMWLLVNSYTLGLGLFNVGTVL